MYIYISSVFSFKMVSFLCFQILHIHFFLLLWQDFSTSAQLTFWTRSCFVVWCCPEHRRMLNSILGPSWASTD